jgi:hypothetical protein
MLCRIGSTSASTNVAYANRTSNVQRFKKKNRDCFVITCQRSQLINSEGNCALLLSHLVQKQCPRASVLVRIRLHNAKQALSTCFSSFLRLLTQCRPLTLTELNLCRMMRAAKLTYSLLLLVVAAAQSKKFDCYNCCRGINVQFCFDNGCTCKYNYNTLATATSSNPCANCCAGIGDCSAITCAPCEDTTVASKKDTCTICCGPSASAHEVCTRVRKMMRVPVTAFR